MIPDDVREYLQMLVKDDDLAELRRQRDQWTNSADYNEAWISEIRLEAGELLAKYTAPNTNEEHEQDYIIKP